MRRATGRACGHAVGLLAAAALSLAACAQNEVSLFIVQNNVPEPGTTNAICVVKPDPLSVFMNTGIVDISLRENYILNPLIRNELQSDQDMASGRAETRGIYFEGIDVDLRIGESTVDNPDAGTITLTDSQGPIPTYYRVYAPTFVPPTVGNTPGYAASTAELIPARIIDALRAQFCTAQDTSPSCPAGFYPNWNLSMVATIKPFGRTMGGIYIEGANFIYPLTFCCHCLVNFPGGSDNPVTPYPDCTGDPPMASATICNLGQDGPVDCRLCSGSPVCQPPGYTVPLTSTTPRCPLTP